MLTNCKDNKYLNCILFAHVRSICGKHGTSTQRRYVHKLKKAVTEGELEKDTAGDPDADGHWRMRIRIRFEDGSMTKRRALTSPVQLDLEQIGSDRSG